MRLTTDFAHAVLLQQSNTAACVQNSVSTRLQRCIITSYQLFHFRKPHSGRAFLPSASKALGFTKLGDYLGGWLAHGSDQYSRVAKRAVTMRQHEVIKAKRDSSDDALAEHDTSKYEEYPSEKAEEKRKRCLTLSVVTAHQWLGEPMISRPSPSQRNRCRGWTHWAKTHRNFRAPNLRTEDTISDWVKLVSLSGRVRKTSIANQGSMTKYSSQMTHLLRPTNAVLAIMARVLVANQQMCPRSPALRRLPGDVEDPMQPAYDASTFVHASAVQALINAWACSSNFGLSPSGDGFRGPSPCNIAENLIMATRVHLITSPHLFVSLDVDAPRLSKICAQAGALSDHDGLEYATRSGRDEAECWLDCQSQQSLKVEHAGRRLCLGFTKLQGKFGMNMHPTRLPSLSYFEQFASPVQLKIPSKRL